MFSTLPRKKFNFSVTFVLLSANVHNLDKSKNFAVEPFPKQALVFRCLQNKSFETMWEKEKLLVTSNKILEMSKLKRLAGHKIEPFPNMPYFIRVCNTSLLKTLWEQEKLLRTSNFSFPTMFSTRLVNFLPFSSNFKLLSANS